MHCVRFLPAGRTVEVPPGTRLQDAVLKAGLPIASGCQGHALCARCGLQILAGGETLGSESPEESRAKRSNRIPPELRLACCVRVAGDLEVTAPYW